MITPTWDLLLSFTLFVFIVFGIVVRKYKISTLLVALYIALAVSSEIGLELFRLIRKLGWGSDNTDLFTVKFFIFAFLGFLLFIEGEHITSAGDDGSSGLVQSVIGGLYGLLAGGIVITSIIHFMSAGDQVALIAKSPIAKTLDGLRIWFLVPFPFILAFSSLIKRFK